MAFWHCSWQQISIASNAPPPQVPGCQVWQYLTPWRKEWLTSNKEDPPGILCIVMAMTSSMILLQLNPRCPCDGSTASVSSSPWMPLAGMPLLATDWSCVEPMPPIYKGKPDNSCAVLLASYTSPSKGPQSDIFKINMRSAQEECVCHL